MPFSIRVSNLDNNLAWEKQLTQIEYLQIKDYNGKSQVPIIPAIFKPVRTNSLKNFSKDFLLPTTLNHTIKIQKIVIKIFAILVSLVLDLFTLPIRLLTCIPRIISNSKKEEHLLYKYLIAENVDMRLLESDQVRVRFEWEQTSQYPQSSWRTVDGVQHSSHIQEQHWLEKNIHFIEVPIYEGSERRVSGMG